MAKLIDRPTFPSILLIIIILLLSIYCLIAIVYYETRIKTLIETKSGKVSGKTVTKLNKRVNCYYGIPYAEPPVGPLRFRKPVPKKRWEGILKADKPIYRCMQESFMAESVTYRMKSIIENTSESKIYENYNITEDCLYLNVFMRSDSDTKSNLTVMVFIHGGGFIIGTANYPIYDGSVLVAHNNVIVVTINYRLGIFGFLSANHSELKGNYGLFDQTLALKWIKSNIISFGGNPDNIVLFGESAGAMSIGFHLISPVSKNLFNRAIMESGSTINWMTIFGKEFINKLTFDAIEYVSCPLSPKSQRDSTQQITDQTISCLRNVSASALNDFQNSLTMKRMIFGPQIDNEFLTEHPLEMINENKFETNIDIMIGTNTMEGILFILMGSLSTYLNSDITSPNLTQALIMSSIPNQILNSTIVETITNITFEGIDDKDHVNNGYRYIQLITSLFFQCPDFIFINKYSELKGNVYYYEYAHKSSIETMFPKWANKAAHGHELISVFGNPFISPKIFSEEEVRLSESVMNTWTQFAINGTAKFNTHEWIRYKKEDPQYMIIDLVNSGMKKGFPAIKCEQYFEIIYKLIRERMTRYNNESMEAISSA